MIYETRYYTRRGDTTARNCARRDVYRVPERNPSPHRSQLDFGPLFSRITSTTTFNVFSYNFQSQPFIHPNIPGAISCSVSPALLVARKNCSRYIRVDKRLA